jgi:hypothetical protein
MSDSSVKINCMPPGLGITLFIVFLILKLTGTIAWSWIWIFAPLWIPLVCLGMLLAFIGLIGVIIASCES